MKIVIRAYGGLRKQLPGHPERLEKEIQRGMTVRDLLADIGLKDADIWLVSINDCIVSHDQELKDGDEVLIFPPVSGG